MSNGGDVQVPEGWRTYRFSEICNVVGGGTPERGNTEYWNGNIPWLSPTEVTGLSNRYISKSKEYITKEGLKKSSAKLLPIGTVLMTSRASIGFPAINNVPVTTNQGFQSLICKEEISYNEFIYQLVLFVRRELERLSAGSTFLEISSTNVKSVKVTLPPLPEQKKIASILTSVDDVIEKTEAQISKLQDLKKGMMTELLTKGIGHTEFKDSPVGRIPVSWEVKRVESLMEKIIDYRGKSPPKSESGTPLITAKNIRKGFIDKEPREYIYSEQYDTWMVRGIPKEGDVLFTTEAPLGNVAPIPNTKLAIGQRTLALCPNRRMMNESYLLWILQSETIQREIELNGTGSTVLGIKQSTFRKIKLPVPPLSEQKHVAEILSAIEGIINSKQNRLSHTKSLKKALMDDLLTGKKRVTIDN